MPLVKKLLELQSVFIQAGLQNHHLRSWEFLPRLEEMLKYGFCNKSFRKDEPLTSWTLLQQICPHFWAWLLNTIVITPKSEDKYVVKVFNWSEVHLSKMTCYKIHTLACGLKSSVSVYPIPTKRGAVMPSGFKNLMASLPFLTSISCPDACCIHRLKESW